MFWCIHYYSQFISLLWIQTTLSMVLLKNPSGSIDNDADNDIADLVIAKGYIPKEKDLPKTSVLKNVDNDATYLLSKLGDNELITLLNEHPNKNEYNLKDLMKIAVDSKSNQKYKPIDFGKTKDVNLNTYFNHKLENIPEIDTEKSKIQSAVFRLDNKEVEPFTVTKDQDPDYVAIQKLHNLLYSRQTEVDVESKTDDDDEEKKELLFDVLVAQLKTLCCKKHKKLKKDNNTRYKIKALLNDIAPAHPVHKTYVPQQKTSVATTMPTEYMFLILNDEMNSNGSDGIISVDPDSLGRNSSVLLLGPITTPLSDTHLKLAMTRISNELSKPEYLPLLQQLSGGTITDENIRLVNSFVSGPETRRYIKPHRCNHQSKLAKIYGGPKWIICTGYLNINTPSLYD